MLPEVRDALDAIEYVLMHSTVYARQDLWDILCALRGPDAVRPSTDKRLFAEVKQSMTVPIRRQAFPNIAAAADSNNAVGFYLPASFQGAEQVDQETIRGMYLGSIVSSHFLGHISSADRALRRKE